MNDRLEIMTRLAAADASNPSVSVSQNYAASASECAALADALIAENARREAVRTPDAGGWVKCSERMPDDAYTVSVYSNGKVFAGHYMPTARVWYVYDERGEAVIAFMPSHWQPLPPPPQEAAK